MNKTALLIVSIYVLGMIPLLSAEEFVENSVTNQDSLIQVGQFKRLQIGPAPGNKIDTIAYKIEEKKAFDIGEILTFKLRYSFIKAGEAQMKVVGTREMDGEQVFHIQTTAKSVPAFDWFYKVRDEVNAFVTVDGFYTKRYEKKLREGGYEVDLFVDYLHDDSLAHVQFFRYDEEGKNQDYTVKVPPFVNDILSSFYYVRKQKLEVGKSLYIMNHEKDNVYELEVKVYRRELLDVDAGEFRCLVVEPLLKGEGIFQQEGRLTIWLTDDDYKIPVQMTSEVAVGHITAELIRIEGVKQPIPAQIY